MEQNNNKLNPHPGAKNLIQSLGVKEVDGIIFSHASVIDTVAKVLGIDPHYLSIQVRLMIPYYSEERVLTSYKNKDVDLISEILVKLRRPLHNFENNYIFHRKRNGIDSLPNALKIVDNGKEMYVTNSGNRYKIKFSFVDSNIGFNIQDDLHYIHKSRKDTKFHFGLFLNGHEYPLCYCSFSVCDRKYQSKSLSFTVGEEVEPSVIYVMTRSFGFTPLPHNMMSKLFDHSIKYIRNFHRNQKEKYPKYIITALNPFLGFSGGIFLGSSFEVFATSPMSYIYNKEGLYLNRRNSDSQTINQSLETPQIAWLVRPLTKTARKRIEKISNYYTITKKEYNLG